MKKDIKPRIILSVFVILLGLIIAAVPDNTTKHFKLGPAELLDAIKNGEQFVYPEQIADMIIKNDPSLILIDVRSPEAYEEYSLPGAINIPLDKILSDEWKDYVDQDVYFNVFYSNGSTIANDAWLICRQLGYRNNFVMMGGLNYWVETILNPSPPSSTSPNDEFAKYDFRKAAGGALGGGGGILQKSETKTKVRKPIIKRGKKKMIQGGCS